MSSRRIPDTDSIDELARFWDTHDLTDFENELEEVMEPVFLRDQSATVAIKLSPEDARTLKRVAEAQGVREATLLRRWVRERLRKFS